MFPFAILFILLNVSSKKDNLVPGRHWHAKEHRPAVFYAFWLYIIHFTYLDFEINPNSYLVRM